MKFPFTDNEPQILITASSNDLVIRRTEYCVHLSPTRTKDGPLKVSSQVRWGSGERRREGQPRRPQVLKREQNVHKTVFQAQKLLFRKILTVIFLLEKDDSFSCAKNDKEQISSPGNK